MVTKNPEIAVIAQEFLLCQQAGLVLSHDGIRPEFPKFFAITQVDKMKSLLMIISQGSQVIVFGFPEIVHHRASALMLVGKNDELILVMVKTFQNSSGGFLSVDILE